MPDISYKCFKPSTLSETILLIIAVISILKQIAVLNTTVPASAIVNLNLILSVKGYGVHLNLYENLLTLTFIYSHS